MTPAERINELAYKEYEKVLEAYHAAVELAARNVFASIGCTDEERVEFFGIGPSYYPTRDYECSYAVEELEVE